MRRGAPPRMTWRLCPKCRKSSATVVDSRWSEEGAVRRRHACRSTKCGHRFTTVEILVPQGGHTAHYMNPVGNAVKIVIDDLAQYLTDRASRLVQR